IREIARRDWALEAAPAILDLLVLGEGVGDESKGADILAEHRAEALRRLLAQRRIMLREEMQCLSAGEILAVDREAQPRHGLVEETDPGGAAGDRFLVQQLLDLVGELVAAEGAGVAQPGRVMRERGVLQLLAERRILDAVQLEGEEQDLARDGVDAL